MIKVLLYGGNGWIGKQFIDILNNKNILYTLGLSRVDNIKDVTDEILQSNSTHIVSMIGRTHGIIDNKVFTTIDYLEQPGKLIDNVKDNLYAPLTLALVCKKLNKHFFRRFCRTPNRQSRKS